MTEPDYLHENTHWHDEHLARLRSSLDEAMREASHAAALHVDLTGPIAAANQDQARLASQIQDVEKVIARISAGYPHFEKAGFKNAVEACGQLVQWQKLSEVPVSGTVYGYDSAYVRLPIQAQEAYVKALTSNLFDSFIVCTCFDLPEDEAGTDVQIENVEHRLFGFLTIPSVADKEALFLVAQW
jgi:hypothetical protein